MGFNSFTKKFKLSRKVPLKKILVFIFMLCAIAQLKCAPEIAWGSPATLSASGVNSSDPQIVMDTNGNVTAAWVENGVIKSSFQPIGMNFGSSQTVSGSSSSAPRLAVDSGGNVTAIWLDSCGIVNSSKLPFGGSWTSSVQISAITGGASAPQLAVDSTGNAIAVWVRNGFIETSTNLELVGTWTLPTMFSSSPNSDGPSVTISAAGTAMIVWHTVVAGQDQILSSKATIGGTWGASLTIIAGTFNNNYPKVAMDPSGNAIAVWYRSVHTSTAYTNVFVAASILTSSSVVWSPAVLLSSAGLGNPANFSARIGIDPSGNAIVAWTISFDGQTYNVESAVLQKGQAFSTPNDIVSQNIYGYEADLSVNSLSNAVFAYMFFDGTNVLIQSTETNVAGAVVNLFTTPTNLSTGSDNGFPRVASTVTGGNILNGAAVWITSNGTNQMIEAAVGSATAVAPPTNLMVTQSSNNFGVFTEYFNTLTWTASTDPNLVAYGLFRDGIFLREVAGNITQFIDDNRVQNGPNTYGVCAINPDGTQSPIATVSFP